MYSTRSRWRTTKMFQGVKHAMVLISRVLKMLNANVVKEQYLHLKMTLKIAQLIRAKLPRPLPPSPILATIFAYMYSILVQGLQVQVGVHSGAHVMCTQ